MAEEGTVDYSEVQQGLTEQPALQESSTQEVEKPKKDKKDKKKEKKAKERTGQGQKLGLREKIKCCMCLNPMTMSKNMNSVEIKGKKVPKNAQGKPEWSSPGARPGRMVGYLCDNCLTASRTTAARADGSGSGVDVKFAVAEKNDGSIMMVPLNDLEND